MWFDIALVATTLDRAESAFEHWSIGEVEVFTLILQLNDVQLHLRILLARITVQSSCTEKNAASEQRSRFVIEMKSILRMVGLTFGSN